MKRRLMESWKYHEEHCGIRSLPRIQQKLIRRAFYFGALGAMTHVVQMATDDLSAKKAFEAFDEMMREISDFQQTMKAGRA
jgi:hypothetical protein